MDMSMSMTTTSMAMSMPSSTSSSMASSSSSMSGSTDMEMSMVMTFFTSARTTLFTTTWTPANDGQYAGTCIFLIVLATILRLLLALRPVLESRMWNDHARNHSGHLLHDHTPDNEQQGDISFKGSSATSSAVQVKHDLASRWSEWRVNAAAGRATYELLVAGVGYLLMLAVMTMNVGYFLSVLAGIWLGTFILGGVAANNQWAHC